MSKLYTEEQLHKLILKYRQNLTEFSFNKPSVQNLIDELTPIELPTNKVIDKVAEKTLSVDFLSFIEGAKWMRDKIKGEVTMSKEQIYEYYKTKTEMMVGHGFHGTLLSKEEFINKCKTDPEFSEKWELKIEERELSTQERNEWFRVHLNGNNPFMKSDWKDFELDQQNIPTKVITITYNNETIESYE